MDTVHLLWLVVAYLVFAPPRYDPAIRIKRRLMLGHWRWEHRR